MTAIAYTPEQISQLIEARRAEVRQQDQERLRHELETLDVVIRWPWANKPIALKVYLSMEAMLDGAEQLSASELDIAEVAGVGTVAVTYQENVIPSVRSALTFLQQLGAVHVEGRPWDESFTERVERKMKERADKGAETAVPRERPFDGSVYEERTFSLVDRHIWLPREPSQFHVITAGIDYQDQLHGGLDRPPTSGDGTGSLLLDTGVAAPQTDSLTKTLLHPIWEECDTALGVGSCRAYYALLVFGPRRIAELAAMLSTSKQNVSNWLKKLQEHGLADGAPRQPWHAAERDLDEVARDMDDSVVYPDGTVYQRTVMERPTARAQVFERLRMNVAQGTLTGPPSVRHERTSRSLDELFKLPLEDAAARMQLETLRHELAIARQRLELEAALRLDAEHAAGWSA